VPQMQKNGTSKWPRRWLIAGALFVLAITLSTGLLLTVGTDRPWKLELHPDWKLAFVLERETLATHPQLQRRISTIYRFGPICLSRSQLEVKPMLPVGTNNLRVGDLLYSSHGQGEMGKVLAIEKWHEFEDGVERPSALFRAASGIEVWMPQDAITNLLVQR
jgi:hypothetical protein